MFPIVKRIRHKYFWIESGEAFYNCSKGTYIGLKQWYDFSKKYSRTEKECQLNYRSEGYITSKTIAWYAKKDNYLEYQKWIALLLKKSICGSLFLILEDVIDLLTNIYNDEFIYCDGWYQFKDHHWQKSDMYDELNTNFENKFKILLSYTEFEENQELYNQIKFNICSLTDILKKKLAKQNFKQIIDSNPNLLPFYNGVIDLKNMVLRPGKPEDYIFDWSPERVDKYLSSDMKNKNVFENGYGIYNITKVKYINYHLYCPQFHLNKKFKVKKYTRHLKNDM